MNNDMARNSNNHINACNNSTDNSVIQKSTASKNEFLKNRTIASVQKFIQNPELAQSHVEFCDSLLDKGYSLIDAIDKTDKIFEMLKEEEIYN